jgi:ACT domain-containing protein
MLSEKYIILKREKKQITITSNIMERCGILSGSVLNTCSEKSQHFLQGSQDNPVHPNIVIVLIAIENLQKRKNRFVETGFLYMYNKL